MSEYYSPDEICEMLEQAHDRGYSLEKGSILEQFTIAELAQLLENKAN